MFFSNIKTILIALYSILIIISVYLTLHFSVNQDIRQKVRTRIQKQIQETKNKIIESSEKSGLQVMLSQAGSPITALHFQLIRYGVILFLTFYYVIIPWLQGDAFSYHRALIFFLLFWATSPAFQFSLTNVVLRRLQILRLSRMNSELFMLYDMIQSELSTLGDQEVNAYNLLMDLHSYFVYIDQPLSKLLSLWKRDRVKAAEEFQRLMPTPEARALIDLIIRMDQTSCKEALFLIEGLAETFATAYSENQKRKKEAFDHILNIPAFGTHLLIIANVLIVIFLEISNLIEFTNLPGG